MTTGNKSYRDVLRQELASRCERNARYSLRAFARDLEFLPSRLSDVLNGRQGLSRKSATHLAKRLGLSSTEKKWFTASVDSRHARSRTRRVEAEKTLSSLAETDEYQVLRGEALFAAIADWYHPAICELTLVPDFQATPQWIGHRLGIPPATAALAIDRLLSLGILRRAGKRLVKNELYVATTNDVPSEAIKRHHQQILQKAASALLLQSVERREFSTNTMVIDPTDLPELKNDLRKFRRSLERKYEKSPRRTEVYCLAQQFFSLTSPGETP